MPIVPKITLEHTLTLDSCQVKPILLLYRCVQLVPEEPSMAKLDLVGGCYLMFRALKQKISVHLHTHASNVLDRLSI